MQRMSTANDSGYRAEDDFDDGYSGKCRRQRRQPLRVQLRRQRNYCCDPPGAAHVVCQALGPGGRARCSALGSSEVNFGGLHVQHSNVTYADKENRGGRLLLWVRQCERSTKYDTKSVSGDF